MYTLNICHLYPDLLNLYGDRGNILSLKMRSKWRGIEANIYNISIGDDFDPEKYDIVFLGGGQDYEQEILQKDLLNIKAPYIKEAIENETVFLCICGGYQLLGKYYKTHDGKEIEFLGALNLWTIAGQKRMIGNMVFECDFLHPNVNARFSGYEMPHLVVGFENHSGKTYLGDGVKPLGKVLKGSGNNGEDSFEGAMYKNVYCSYSHGSLLPKNPALSDHILLTALKRKYPKLSSLDALDDQFENLAHNKMAEIIMSIK